MPSQELLLSYNVALDRDTQQRRMVERVAARVGLDVRYNDTQEPKTSTEEPQPNVISDAPPKG